MNWYIGGLVYWYISLLVTGILVDWYIGGLVTDNQYTNIPIHQYTNSPVTNKPITNNEMFDMMGMLGKVKDLQAKMKEAQESLGSIIETGESGAGMVRATVNGKKQLLKIEIDEDLIRPEDREVLQDLVVAATNKAMENIEDKVKAHLQNATQGLMPNIPGMDLGGMFS